MASVVDIKFVDEPENFDFEKSGKSSRPRIEDWSMLYNKYNTIQYNTLLTTPHGGFSVTMQLKEVTIVSKKTKVNSKKHYIYPIAESDEGDVESTESRDASSFEEDVEISSFEKSSNFDLGFHWIMRRREKSSQVSSQWHLIL